MSGDRDKHLGPFETMVSNVIGILVLVISLYLGIHLLATVLQMLADLTRFFGLGIADVGRMFTGGDN